MKIVTLSDRRPTSPSADWPATVRAALIGARTAAGHWEGRLSTSALSTATAVIALGTAGADRRLVDQGAVWLAAHANADGGWGDTPQSLSNISTTALAWGALNLAPTTPATAEAAKRGAAWLSRAAGGVDGSSLRRALDARYGKDRTFSVPILTALTIAGRLGDDGWRHVAQLPFELAAAPHQLYAALRLPVVSYALPALIAIGQARHVRHPTRNPLTRLARQATRRRTLATLRAIQPATGGFLEATPLTSFVVMSLVAAGARDHAVVEHGLAFLRASVRDDGSWPIDTNLATWVTTLAIEALAAGGPIDRWLGTAERARLLDWLLAQQYRVEHPYTHAAPGGWAWTDLAGGVPDADDTAGALLALAHLGGPDADVGDRGVRDAAAAGVRWLLDLQNRDGGIPTFCRGWTGLPFDRSGPELTAHAIRAWSAWRPHLDATLVGRLDAGLARAARYLAGAQHGDGAFEPLWFGNEAAPGEVNLTYGTAKVLPALDALADAGIAGAAAMADRAARWLAAAQQPEGGWAGTMGGAAGATPPRASIEETAQAVAALATHAARTPGTGTTAIRRGLAWLREATDQGRAFPAAPIGLYFARLWYSEALYPVIFTAAATQAAARVLDREAAGR